MENLFLIKTEIIIVFFSFLYFMYYLIGKLIGFYSNIKNIVKKEEIKETKTALNKLSIKNKEKKYNPKSGKKVISGNELVQLNELIKRVKINSSKGYFDTAKGLIIEGLSIDKLNKELNLELASIYEREKCYKNAELIYKDLVENIKDDFLVLKKLGYVLAMQDKLGESFEVYNKIHHKKMADEEVVNMLSEISFKLEKYKESLSFIKMYLKNKPRDTDKLFMKAECYEYFRDFSDSINVYKRIIELQPYNTKARDKITELEQFII